MSDDKSDQNQIEPDEPAPLNLAELKLRLLYGDSGESSSHFKVIEELMALGKAAAPLVAVVAAQYRGGKLKAPESWLVKLYLNTRQEELLAAFREKGAFGRFNIFDKCDLFASGVAEFEPVLRQYLWENWNNPADPGRSEVVKVLGPKGDAETLELLGVIRFRMAGQLAEEQAKHDANQGQDIDAAERFLWPYENRANIGFLERVRKAISEIEARGDSANKTRRMIDMVRNRLPQPVGHFGAKSNPYGDNVMPLKAEEIAAVQRAMQLTRQATSILRKQWNEKLKPFLTLGRDSAMDGMTTCPCCGTGITVKRLRDHLTRMHRQNIEGS